jgi:hypothetical protein
MLQNLERAINLGISDLSGCAGHGSSQNNVVSAVHRLATDLPTRVSTRPLGGPRSAARRSGYYVAEIAICTHGPLAV